MTWDDEDEDEDDCGGPFFLSSLQRRECGQNDHRHRNRHRFGRIMSPGARRRRPKKIAAA